MINQREIEETFKTLGLLDPNERERILAQGKIISKKRVAKHYILSTDSSTR